MYESANYKWLLMVLFLLIFVGTASAQISINEVLANGLDDPKSEWVELFNNGSIDVDLTNWNISETSSSNFTLSGVIPPKGYAVLTRNFTVFNSTYPKVNMSGTRIIEITISSFNLADTGGEIWLYNSSGMLADNFQYAQASGKAFENVSIGRYPDGSSTMANLSTPTPGEVNDNQAPTLNKWINPPANGTKVSALANITVNITDDAKVNSSVINFNGTNFSMNKNGDLWRFLWNTSLNAQGLYNISIFFNDSNGKSGSDRLLNIFVNNSPFMVSFSPSSLNVTMQKNSSLNFSVNASDPDDALLNFSWLIDSLLNSTLPSNFTYSPGLNDNGTHTLNVTVKDKSSNQVSMAWAVKVTNINTAPVLNAILNRTVPKGVNSSFNVTANDPDNDALAFFSNKSSISISKFNNSIATVSWKPTNLDAGNNTINFTVSDGIASDSKIIVITVNSTGNSAPAITTSPITTATVNQTYSYDVDASDADNDALTYSLTTNATNMAINSSTGFISFISSVAGVFSVKVSVSDLIAITNQSYSIEVQNASPPGAPASSSFGKLKIIDVDAKIDGKKSSNIKENSKISKDAEPGSKVELKVRVFNNFTKAENLDIEDIEVRITIEGIDNGDDFEDESKNFDLSAQDDKTVTFRLAVPLNADEDSFDVIIEAEGEDENGTNHGHTFRTEIEVDKNKHDLRFLRLGFNPEAVNCSRNFAVSYTIINVGEEDEEDAFVKVTNDLLGIDLTEKGISLSSGTEDNTISKSVKIIPGNEAEAGSYPINLGVYSGEGKLLDTKTQEIGIGNCAGTREKSESKFVFAANRVEVQPTEAAKEKIDTPLTRVFFMQDDRTAMLVLSTLVFTSFFVFIAIVLFILL
ncbi:lamin tail domain-containing protein [Candidatus Woesearchaeota archaeon]|nr:lamin tail domain-containing protein [Candidatus Woesearchaeota archaeon]